MSTQAMQGLGCATDYQRKPLRVINAAWRGLNRLGLARISLDPDGLLSEARAATGLEDFGDTRFEVSMRQYLHAAETEAALNPLGRVLTRMSALRMLKNLLWARDLEVRHPEISERSIVAPVVVLGLARSGTTRMHRLLAGDPAFLRLQAWESVNPVPTPECLQGPRDQDPRPAAIEQALKAVLYMSPQIQAVHPLGAWEVEEEVGLLQHAFSTQLFEVITRVPSFAQWLEQNDQTYAYETMMRLLKIIAWYRKDPLESTWVLKTPQHMQDLDALLNVLPDARFVCTHRDPVKVMGSLCSMTWNSRVRDTDQVDPHEIGAAWLNKCVMMLNKVDGLREQRIAAENQIDVLYQDISTDWQGTVAGIYDWLGMSFGDEARGGMQAWLDSNSQHKHGAHRYCLEDFGLNANQVEEALGFYRKKYAIPFETHNPHTAKTA